MCLIDAKCDFTLDRPTVVSMIDSFNNWNQTQWSEYTLVYFENLKTNNNKTTMEAIEMISANNLTFIVDKIMGSLFTNDSSHTTKWYVENNGNTIVSLKDCFPSPARYQGSIVYAQMAGCIDDIISSLGTGDSELFDPFRMFPYFQLFNDSGCIYQIGPDLTGSTGNSGGFTDFFNTEMIDYLKDLINEFKQMEHGNIFTACNCTKPNAAQIHHLSFSAIAAIIFIKTFL